MIRQNSKLPNLVKSFLVIIFKETFYEMKKSGKEIQHTFSKKMHELYHFWVGVKEIRTGFLKEIIISWFFNLLLPLLG